VEAVAEVPDVKRDIFSRLDQFCPGNTVIASNTSSLDIFDIEQITRPERLVVAHWRSFLARRPHRRSLNLPQT
ncbi:MAG: hypothetical protein JRI73_08240, partial [Deltaproteobacteria bacterium]|nr:hypothetical protein [Deltaproteobacteria bacterium]